MFLVISLFLRYEETNVAMAGVKAALGVCSGSPFVLGAALGGGGAQEDTAGGSPSTSPAKERISPRREQLLREAVMAFLSCVLCFLF